MKQYKYFEIHANDVDYYDNSYFLIDNKLAKGYTTCESDNYDEILGFETFKSSVNSANNNNVFRMYFVSINNDGKLDNFISRFKDITFLGTQRNVILNYLMSYSNLLQTHVNLYCQKNDGK